MALANGLLVHGPTTWGVAVRTADGQIKTASGKKKTLGKRVDGVPGLRGIVKLAESLVVIGDVKRSLPEAKLPFESSSNIKAAAIAAAASGLVKKRNSELRGELAAALISLAPAIASLKSGEVANYHAAEHKAIAAYEQDLVDPMMASKEHERCGSHLVAPSVILNVLGLVVAKRLIGHQSKTAELLVSLGSLAVTVELFIWSEKNADSKLTKLLKLPGFELQRSVGTREPSRDQLEVGQSALETVLQAEGVSV